MEPIKIWLLVDFVVKFSTAREMQHQLFSLTDNTYLVSQTHYRRFIWKT